MVAPEGPEEAYPLLTQAINNIPLLLSRSLIPAAGS